MATVPETRSAQSESTAADLREQAFALIAQAVDQDLQLLDGRVDIRVTVTLLRSMLLRPVEQIITARAGIWQQAHPRTHRRGSLVLLPGDGHSPGSDAA